MRFSKRAILIAATGLSLGLAFHPVASIAQGVDVSAEGMEAISQDAKGTQSISIGTKVGPSTLLCCGGMAAPEMEPIIIEAN